VTDGRQHHEEGLLLLVGCSGKVDGPRIGKEEVEEARDEEEPRWVLVDGGQGLQELVGVLRVCGWNVYAYVNVYV
jgi:hypothetical protein